MTTPTSRIAWTTLTISLIVVVGTLSFFLYQANQREQMLATNMQQLIEQRTQTQQEQPAQEEPLPVNDQSCKPGEVRYQSVHTPLSFCYPSRFGGIQEEETDIALEFREGQSFEFRFDKSDARVTVETADFKPTGPTDWPGLVDFACLKSESNPSNLTTCFPHEVASIKRNIINDHDAYLVTLLMEFLEEDVPPVEETYYFIPSLIDAPTYNVTVKFPPEGQTEVERIIESTKS